MVSTHGNHSYSEMKSTAVITWATLFNYLTLEMFLLTKNQWLFEKINLRPCVSEVGALSTPQLHPLSELVLTAAISHYKLVHCLTTAVHYCL